MILVKQTGKRAIRSKTQELLISKMTELVAPAIVYLIIFILIGLSCASVSSATELRTQQSVEVYNPAGVRPDNVYVDRLLQKTMAQMGKTKPALAGEFPDEKIEKVKIHKDSFAEINELFYNRGWTDGLPIVPPTAERVKEFTNTRI